MLFLLLENCCFVLYFIVVLRITFEPFVKEKVIDTILPELFGDKILF